MKNMRKKSVAVLLGLAVTGLVGASAATLGGIDSASLGADVADVGSCDSDGVTVDFTTAFENGVTEVRLVTVGDVAEACDTLDYVLTLATEDPDTGATGSVERTGQVTLVNIVSGSGEFSANFNSLNVDAEDVVGVALSISGR